MGLYNSIANTTATVASPELPEPATDGSAIQSLEEIKVSGLKWVVLKKIHWIDPENNPRIYEVVERKTRPKSGVDTVIVACVIKNTESSEYEIVCVKQFRPPAGRLCVEFPAGLVEDGEDAKDAALRELYEETGYKGTFINESELFFSSPGLTNETRKIVYVEIDQSLPENKNLQQHLDAGEYVSVFKIPLREFPEVLADLYKDGVGLDAELMGIGMGLKFARKYNLFPNSE